MEEEVWKIIPRYDGTYEASNLGRIKSFRNGRERILIPSNSSGYKTLNLFRYGKRVFMRVHVLVAMAFLDHGPCKNGMVVDHINGDKSDNRVENLRVVTQKFNVSEGYRKDRV